MKSIVFLFAALFVGASIDFVNISNIPADVSALASSFYARASAVAGGLTSGLNSNIATSLANIQIAWNAFSGANFPLTSIPIIPSGLNSTFNTAIDNVELAFADSNQLANNIVTSLQNTYNNTIQQYNNFANATNAALQCWYTAKPQICAADKTYLDSVKSQSLPLVANYTSYVAAQTLSVTGTLVSYQNGVAACALRVLPSQIISCKAQYVS